MGPVPGRVFLGTPCLVLDSDEIPVDSWATHFAGCQAVVVVVLSCNANSPVGSVRFCYRSSMLHLPVAFLGKVVFD